MYIWLMKIKLLLGLIAICLISCEKKPIQKIETKEPNPIIATQDKTVSISCQTSCSGQLRMIWEYDYNNPSTDSIYSYTSTKLFTKIITGDSIRIYFYSSICTTCSPCANQVTVYVNGIAKQSWSNDMGGVFHLIKL